MKDLFFSLQALTSIRRLKKNRVYFEIYNILGAEKQYADIISEWIVGNPCNIWAEKWEVQWD